jgi:MtN3 and saliva related transmembrane protein
MEPKMNSFSIEAVGLIAGAMTTLSFLPQVLKAWKSKETKDLSLIMYLVLCTGVFMWLVYGLLIDSPSIIIANAVTFVLVLAVLVMKLRFG